MISKTLLERLDTARRVVFFTGAGVSAESGVATFRASDGLWAKFKPEELASMDAFLANPQLVWEWYQARRDMVLHAKPNPGHYAIAEMEELIPEVSVATQNIDGLHAAAGSTEVLELHGSIRRNFCQRCGTSYDGDELLTVGEVQRCGCGGMIRPAVVWFGEMLPEKVLQRAEMRAQSADVLFSVGTSSVVYPAAAIPMIAREEGAYVVEINPEETPLSPIAHEAIRDASGSALPRIVQMLRERRGTASPQPAT